MPPWRGSQLKHRDNFTSPCKKETGKKKSEMKETNSYCGAYLYACKSRYQV
jgi:hypothetical protein